MSLGGDVLELSGGSPFTLQWSCRWHEAPDMSSADPGAAEMEELTTSGSVIGTVSAGG